MFVQQIRMQASIYKLETRNYAKLEVSGKHGFLIRVNTQTSRIVHRTHTQTPVQVDDVIGDARVDGVIAVVQNHKK